MQTSAHVPQGNASDSLMLQINIDNVASVYQRMDEQVRTMQESRWIASRLRSLPPCGDDPVSRDAVTVFQPKVDTIVGTHENYLREVVDARDRLKQAAQEYGLIEDENTATLKSTAPPSNGPLLER